MKRILPILCVTLFAYALAAPAQVTPGTVEPDRGNSKAAPVLSPEERERLQSLTRVVVSPAAKPGAEAAAAAQPIAEPSEALAKRVEAADQLLGKLSRDASGAASELMMSVLDSPEPALRITALHWLAGRRDVAAESLARGLSDPDGLVRTVAENLLVERGLSDETIAKVKAAVSKGKDSLALEVRDALAAAR